MRTSVNPRRPIVAALGVTLALALTAFAPTLSAGAAGTAAASPTEFSGPVGPPVCTNVGDGTPTVVDAATSHLEVFCKAFTASMSIEALHGDVTMTAYGSIYYTADFGYRGTDTITVTAVVTRAGTGPTTTFDVEVVGRSVVRDDTFAIDGGGPTAPTVSILDNDTMTYPGWTVQVGTTPPAHGTVTVDSHTGLLVYEPDADFHGTDRILYLLNGRDGARSNIGVVTFVVA
jgi:hypothetical protein